MLRRLVGATAARALSVGRRGRNYIIGFTSDLPQSIAHVNMYFDKWSRYRLLSDVVRRHVATKALPEEYKANLCTAAHSPLRQASAVDFQTYLVDQILVKVDRASMLASLEVRAPWLDYRIIEFAFGRTPDLLRANGKERKILPRRLAEQLLPQSLDLKRKQGFSMPLTSWFKGECGIYIEAVLEKSDPRLFDQEVVQTLLYGQRHGYSNTQRLFALVMFELWRREYKVEIPL